ncbi:aminoglycoside phosphotransferase family protein [uncultured Lacinutrix sp.]|uniref:phosphotransferase family protein n=1 Tax=uncultured Lacinutrix sp. TaxID=574032 RepID=UPI0026094C9A|nr:aminoglycoside phosphotransferase family protein [uncultured Lacinutrix sp.]
MRLEPLDVYNYLYKRQIVDASEVIKGNYLIQPVRTRNNIMKIVIGPNNSLFIKQMASDLKTNNLFEREINTYHLFKENKSLALMSKYVPPLIHCDKENNIMVTELFYGAKSLHDYYMNTKKFDLNLAEEQAKILSTYHVSYNKLNNFDKLPKNLPWILQLDKHKAHEFFVGNKASTAVISLIKENNQLQETLIGLAKKWQFTHLIHGDVKWVNFLISKDEQSQKLIDWELADIGDPIWDIAGLLQSYITAWLFGFDNNDPFNQSLPKDMEPYDIKHMKPSAKAFLFKYLELQNYPRESYNAFFIKTMQLTAARIIQTSVEGTTYSLKVEANNIRCVQLAFNIIKNPLQALSELFNIKTEVYV